MAGQLAVINLNPMDEELLHVFDKRKVDDRVKFLYLKIFNLLVNKMYDIK